MPLLPDTTETTLEARIQHARDSVFDEELFHEVLRESRALTSLGIAVRGSVIGFDTQVSEDVKAELELISLDDVRSQAHEPAHDYDRLAQAMLLTARLLLGKEHRERLNKKREIPLPMSSKQAEAGQHSNVLRPLILVLEHHSLVRELNAYMDKVCELVRSAGVHVEFQAAKFALPIDKDGSIGAQSLVTSLLRPIRAVGSVSFVAADDSPLQSNFTVESSVSTTPGSSFTVQSPTGQKVIFTDLEDSLRAADEAMALTLTRVLTGHLGDGWSLDERQGTLSREGEGIGRQVLGVAIDGRKCKMTLWADTSTGRKTLDWRLPVDGSARMLNDAWKDLVG